MWAPEWAAGKRLVVGVVPGKVVEVEGVVPVKVAELMGVGGLDAGGGGGEWDAGGGWRRVRCW